MVKRKVLDKSPEKQRLGGKKPFAGENDIIIDENEFNEERKVKSPIKSPLRKNINTVSFNPASKKGKLSFFKRKSSKIERQRPGKEGDKTNGVDGEEEEGRGGGDKEGGEEEGEGAAAARGEPEDQGEAGRGGE